jgi:hypothetical protein
MRVTEKCSSLLVDSSRDLSEETDVHLEWSRRPLCMLMSICYSMKPRFRPIITACVRSFAWSFAKRLRTCPFTVSSEI